MKWFALSFVIALAGCAEPKPVGDRITASCDKQFGPGTSASTDCQVRLMTEELAKRQSDQMDRARQGAR